MRLEIATRRFYLGRDYSDALEAAGGLPVHIPLIPDERYLASVMEDLDGVLLPGCDTDVDPGYYGEDPHPMLGKVIPEKDQTDMLVLAEAEKRNIPVFAICYGIQVLNVSRGGTLIQDIEAQVENCLQHRQGEPIARNSHEIKMEADSLLAEIGGELISAKLKVNSHHHQAIGRIGRNLRAIAWANDGIIEGIQDIRPERYVIGTQWHPELSWNSDDFSRSIFEAFVTRCSVQSEEGKGTVATPSWG